MSWRYEYTPYVWPALISAACMAGVAIYAWRRRSVSGALLFAVTLCLCVPWALGDALVLSAVDPPAKIFRAKFHTLWMLPIGTATLCFVLDYANMGRWLNRRTLSLLSIPPLLLLLMAVTNDAHHLLWLRFPVTSYVVPQYGIVGWIDFGSPHSPLGEFRCWSASCTKNPGVSGGRLWPAPAAISPIATRRGNWRAPRAKPSRAGCSAARAPPGGLRGD